VLEVFAHSHWTCATCGNWQRGIERPERCSQCGGQRFMLEHADPGP
jgi:rubrerythrin